MDGTAIVRSRLRTGRRANEPSANPACLRAGVDLNPDINLAERSPVEVNPWLYQIDGSALEIALRHRPSKTARFQIHVLRSNHADAQELVPSEASCLDSRPHAAYF
jgi:hypothetical protein